MPSSESVLAVSADSMFVVDFNTRQVSSTALFDDHVTSTSFMASSKPRKSRLGRSVSVFGDRVHPFASVVRSHQNKEGDCEIWALSSMRKVASIRHSFPVVCTSAAENSENELLTCDNRGFVKLWDLRTLKKPLFEFERDF